MRMISASSPSNSEQYSAFPSHSQDHDFRRVVEGRRAYWKFENLRLGKANYVGRYCYDTLKLEVFSSAERFERAQVVLSTYEQSIVDGN